MAQNGALRASCFMRKISPSDPSLSPSLSMYGTTKTDYVCESVSRVVFAPQTPFLLELEQPRAQFSEAFGPRHSPCPCLRLLKLSCVA